MAKQAHALRKKLSENKQKEDCGIIVNQDEAFVEYNKHGKDTFEDVFVQIAKTLRNGGEIEWKISK